MKSSAAAGPESSPVRKKSRRIIDPPPLAILTFNRNIYFGSSHQVRHMVRSASPKSFANCLLFITGEA